MASPMIPSPRNPTFIVTDSIIRKTNYKRTHWEAKDIGEYLRCVKEANINHVASHPSSKVVGESGGCR